MSAYSGLDIPADRHEENLKRFRWVVRQVEHYRIVGKLGQGGMGEGCLAEDTSLSRNVALKFLPETLQQDEIARVRNRLAPTVLGFSKTARSSSIQFTSSDFHQGSVSESSA